MLFESLKVALWELRAPCVHCVCTVCACVRVPHAAKLTSPRSRGRREEYQTQEDAGLRPQGSSWLGSQA